MDGISDLLVQYFRSKTKQLLAMSQSVVTQHPTLKGSHREEIIRIYLADILPKRFKIGKGMVYGIGGKSKECDIVLWDSMNYPSLQMLGHNLFFAEAVKAVLEIKTTWNSKTFREIRLNSKSLKKIITSTAQSNIYDELENLRAKIEEIVTNKRFEGRLIKRHQIATGAIVLQGGKNLMNSFNGKMLEDIDEEFPDILLLLEPGIVVRKDYIGNFDYIESGTLEFIEAGENALAVFTAAWLGLLNERSIYVEEPLYLENYLYDLFHNLNSTSIEFPLSFPHIMPGSLAFWSEDEISDNPLVDEDRTYKRQLELLKKRYGTYTPESIRDYWFEDNKET